MTEPESKPFATHLLAATEARLVAADGAWIAELAATFGDHNIDAMAAQRAGRGEEGSELRALHQARDAALADWRSARGLP